MISASNIVDFGSTSSGSNAPAARSAVHTAPQTNTALTEQTARDLVAGSPEQVQRAVATLRATDTMVIPAGTVLRGDLEAKTVLIVGSFSGRLVVTEGPLVVVDGAVLEGSGEINGDMLIAGKVIASEQGYSTQGKLMLSQSATATGTFRFRQIAIFEGAQVNANLGALDT